MKRQGPYWLLSIWQARCFAAWWRYLYGVKRSSLRQGEGVRAR